MPSNTFSMDAIACIRSCYPQRFGIPRQPGLVPSAVAAIEFDATRDNELALRDLESFSHLWIIFVFHQQHYKEFKPLVQPPRLGGRKTIGVYATRSPNRPNPIGLSAVRLHEVTFERNVYRVVVGGGDFLDGTPVLDIKPYVPFVDAIAQARSDWATPIENTLSVVWEEEVLQHFDSMGLSDDSVQTGTCGLKTLIEETLAQDPRPAHERAKDGREGQRWGIVVGPLDVRFKVENGVVVIVSVREFRR